MLKINEGHEAARPTCPSKAVVCQIDTFENSTNHPIIQRLSRRYGVSAEVAALVAELSGLGPREASR